MNGRSGCIRNNSSARAAEESDHFSFALFISLPARLLVTILKGVKQAGVDSKLGSTWNDPRSIDFFEVLPSHRRDDPTSWAESSNSHVFAVRGKRQATDFI